MTTQDVHDHLTDAFIDGDPTDIVLTRRVKLADGAGGHTWANGLSRASQRMRLIPQQDGQPELATSDGRKISPTFRLIAPLSSSMERFDRFTWKGEVWEIAAIHNKPSYELKGDVVLVG